MAKRSLKQVMESIKGLDNKVLQNNLDLGRHLNNIKNGELKEDMIEQFENFKGFVSKGLQVQLGIDLNENQVNNLIKLHNHYEGFNVKDIQKFRLDMYKLNFVGDNLFKGVESLETKVELFNEFVSENKNKIRGKIKLDTLKELLGIKVETTVETTVETKSEETKETKKTTTPKEKGSNPTPKATTGDKPATDLQNEIMTQLLKENGLWDVYQERLQNEMAKAKLV